MARIELAPGVMDDIDRFLAHLAEFGSADIPERIDEMLQVLQVLAHSPLIGRPVQDGKRELIIGKGGRGHVALYRYLADIETVFILALRAQREAGVKH